MEVITVADKAIQVLFLSQDNPINQESSGFIYLNVVGLMGKTREEFLKAGFEPCKKTGGLMYEQYSDHAATTDTKAMVRASQFLKSHGYLSSVDIKLD